VLAAWREALSPDADLLIYGCSVAAGSDGIGFVHALSELTGADVAASDDATGSAAAGGDWALEVTSGAIEHASGAVDGFSGLLLPTSITDSTPGTRTVAEDGTLTVAGKLGIPAPVELFPKKEYKKQILPLAAPSIPIFGFAVAGVNVGVFLNIDGSLDFIASFGPGQLTEASVGITWSPDDEDATELDGKATFVIPAYAGLKLTVDAGLGVGAAVISAIGGLSVWGELGVKASAGLGVDLKWKPGLGIKLNGEAKADAEAVLKLGAGGFIKVVAKIIDTIYEERFPAGEFTLGSGLKIGVTLPVSYEPDKSFELDFSKIDIRTPEISAGDLVDKIKDQLPSP